jgi:pimeloyl-ACP methyl ester carboxylesterase
MAGMEAWIARTPQGVVVVRSADGQLTIDRPDADPFRIGLIKVADFPRDFARQCGWYDLAGETVLLTQYPEEFFGEPMLLLSKGDSVTRLYPLDSTRMLGEDGTELNLATLRRSGSYVERELGNGTLMMPGVAGPHPVAIQVHGAAIGQRDFNRLFAQPFLDAGTAVYIFDKEPGGTIFARADAISTVMDRLAGFADVDAQRIGLAGFSNGMWSVPMVAARRDDVAFITGIGAPGVSQGESELHRRTKLLRDAGVSERSAALVGQAWQVIFAIAGAGSADHERSLQLATALATVGQLPDLYRYEPPDYVRNNPMLSPIPPSLDAQEVIRFLSGPGDPELSYDPTVDYERVTCPVFLQYGQLDTSVPVAESVSRVEAALTHAGVPHDIRVYPGLEHILNVLPAGLPAQLLETSIHGFHRFRFGPGVRGDLTKWLRERQS